MKKILSAWIEQFIEFDSEMEFAVFEQKLKDSKKGYRIIHAQKCSDGKYKIHIIRQYNNNQFPKAGEDE